MGSPSLIEESHQWRINGSNLYPYAISSANEHLALQNDLWGVSYQPLGGCPFIGVKTLVDEVAVNELVEHFPDAEALLGETSYICANFHGRTIKELQLTYSSLGLVNGNRYNEAMTLLIYAEVQRVIVPSKSGGYVIAYL